MFLRNLLILALFARAAVTAAALPIFVMALVAGVCIWFQSSRMRTQLEPISLSSPLSLPKILKFGFIFIAIELLGSLGQRYLGHFGFLLVSVIGGLATVLTSMTSALSNLPLLHQQVRQWHVTRKVALLSGLIVAAGLLAMLFTTFRM